MSLKSFLYGLAMQLLDSVPRVELDALHNELEFAKRDIESHKLRLDAYEKGYANKEEEIKNISDELNHAKNTIKEVEWCWSGVPSGIEMLPTQLQNRIASTIKCLSRADNPNIQGILWRSKTKSDAIWSFYWCLTHAAVDAAAEVKKCTDENGITRVLVGSLAKHVSGSLRSFSHSPLLPIEIGITEIYSKIKPAIKEASVGADLLIMISGSGLLPKGGVRLVWVQSKLASPMLYQDGSYRLNYWREKNSAGVYQFDALRSLHVPDQGSYAIYAQYSALPFVLTASFKDLPSKAPATPSESVFDLGVNGCRFQETLAALAFSGSIGQFSSAQEAISFLDGKTKQSIIPLNVVTACAKGDWQGQSLLNEIEQHYTPLLNRALGLPEPTKQIGHDLSL